MRRYTVPPLLPVSPAGFLGGICLAVSAGGCFCSLSGEALGQVGRSGGQEEDLWQMRTDGAAGCWGRGWRGNLEARWNSLVELQKRMCPGHSF